MPHIVFSIAPDEIGLFLEAAEAAGCGLTNNGRYAELYVDMLPKMLAFAREIQRRL